MGLRDKLSRKKPEKLVTPAGVNSAPGTMGTPVLPPSKPIGCPVMSSWDGTRFKIQLKMAKNRVDIQRGKKDNEIESTRRTIAQHLSNNKEPLARILAERVLRERNSLIAFDVLDTCIELLVSSNHSIGMQRVFDDVPEDTKEAVASVVFASSRVNVPELTTVVQLLREHFGPHIIDPIGQLQGPHFVCVNKVLALKLSGTPPDGYLILQELHQIAIEHEIAWTPPPEDSDLNLMGPGGGGGGPAHFYNPPFPPPPPPPSGGHDSGGGYTSAPFSYAPEMPTAPDFNTLPPPPSNIPGYNNQVFTPSAPPPFDPAGSASGSLYPTPGGAPPPPVPMDQHTSRGLPQQSPADPQATDCDPSILSDTALEQKLRNIMGKRS